MNDVDEERSIGIGRHGEAAGLNDAAQRGNAGALELLAELLKVLGVAGFGLDAALGLDDVQPVERARGLAGGPEPARALPGAPSLAQVEAQLG